MADYISALTGSMMDVALTDMAQHTSEAWAVGKRNGIPVEEGDPTYHNNAKYWAEQLGNITDKSLYVNGTTGDDGNDGSQAYPFKTIQAAINSVPKYLGNFQVVISVADGTYTENVVVEDFFGAFNLNGSIRIYGNATIVGSLTIRECNCNVNVQLFTITPASQNATGINIHSCSSVSVQNVTVDCTNGTAQSVGIDSRISPVNAIFISCTIRNAIVGLWGNAGRYALSQCRFENVETAINANPRYLGDGTGLVLYENCIFTNVTNKFSGPKLVESSIEGNTLYMTL